jgi:tRNA dimethylallyltransferase
MTWFNNKIKNIEWIDLDKYDENEAISKIENILKYFPQKEGFLKFM